MRRIIILSIFVSVFNYISSASLPDSVNKNDEHLIRKLSGGHTDEINFIHQLQNGLLASAGKDANIVIRNIETGEIVQILKGHKSSILEVRQLADGALVSASSDGTFRFWNLDTGVNVKTIENNFHPSYYGLIGFNSLLELPGNRLAVGDGFALITIWDTKTYRKLSDAKLGSSRIGIFRMKLFADGETIGVCHSSGAVSLQKLEGNYLTWKGSFYEHDFWSTNDIEEVDDEYLITGAGDETLRIWSRKTFVRKARINTDSGVYQLKKLSNNRIASAQRDGTVKIWDLDTNQLVKTLRGHTKRVSSLEILSDGNLASSSEDMQVIIWDTEKILNS